MIQYAHETIDEGLNPMIEKPSENIMQEKKSPSFTPIPYKNHRIFSIEEFVVTEQNTVEVEWRSVNYPHLINLTSIENLKSIDWNDQPR